MIGENEAAIEDCSHAIQLNPQYYRAYYGRGAARSYIAFSVLMKYTKAGKDA
jgi:hypothetical protein